jgi:hypothetical protein
MIYPDGLKRSRIGFDINSGREIETTFSASNSNIFKNKGLEPLGFT